MMGIGILLKHRYRITDVIGSGGTSDVYLVYDTHLQKNWALKVVHGQLHRQLARQEIQILIGLDHRMIPKIVDAWQYESDYYIVCDYVEGITLLEILKNGALGSHQTIEWMIGIADALTYLHELDTPVMYQDLKPANIMIRRDGTPMLVDFGIASFVNGRRMNYGTDGYAAPELYDSGGGGAYDERSDIYSFGITYLCMRTGKPPDSKCEDNYVRILNSHELTHKERTFLKHCISTEPDHRFSSMREVGDYLKHIDNKSFVGRKKRRVVVGTAIFAGMAIIIGARLYEAMTEDKAAQQMMEESSACMEEGEYTSEGLKIIEAYIASGRLSERVEQEYSYTVAKNYFGIKKDYIKAGEYFARLDEEQYPNKEYYIQLCSLQTGFGVDGQSLYKCLRRFYADLLRQEVNAQRFENMLLIASCYEWCPDDEINSMRCAASVLERGIVELEEMNDTAPDKCRYLELFRKKLEFVNMRREAAVKASYK